LYGTPVLNKVQVPDDPPPRKILLIFFRADAGREPVREWLKGLPEAERHTIGKDLLRAQLPWPVGMPLCRPLGGGLWEIRTDLLGAQASERVGAMSKNIWVLA
jgi:hypothetical protein